MTDDRTSILAHEQRFFDALTKGDVEVLGTLLTDDFVLVAVDSGAVVRRDELLALVSSGELKFPEIQTFHEEALVRRAGEAGIVVGRTGMTFTDADGHTFTAGSRYTHVFRISPSGWQLMSAQGTEIKP